MKFRTVLAIAAAVVTGAGVTGGIAATAGATTARPAASAAQPTTATGYCSGAGTYLSTAKVYQPFVVNLATQAMVHLSVVNTGLTYGKEQAGHVTVQLTSPKGTPPGRSTSPRAAPPCASSRPCTGPAAAT